MNRLRPVLAACLVLLVTACKDYGEFTVAERRWVDDEAFPALSEIDLRDINMEFAIGSELHARLVPDAWWPQPIRALLDQVRRDNGGVLPDEFDLPIPDACIYVDAELKSSRFRRLRSGDRTLFFVSSVLRKENSMADSKTVPELEYQPELSIIEEGRQFNLMGSFALDSVEFEVAVRDEIAYIFTASDRLLFMTSIDVRQSDAQLIERRVIFDAGARIDVIKVDENGETLLDIAILTDRYANHTERKIFFGQLDPGYSTTVRFNLVTDTASWPALFMSSINKNAVLSWIDARFIHRGFFETDNPGKVALFLPDDGGLQNPGPMILNLPLDDTDNAEMPLLASTMNEMIFVAWGTYESLSVSGIPMAVSMLSLTNNSLILRKSPVGSDVIRAEAVSQYADLQRSFPMPGVSNRNDEYCDSWLDRLPDNGVRVLDPVTHKPVRPWP